MTTAPEKSMGVSYSYNPFPGEAKATYTIRWCETDVGTVRMDLDSRRYAKAWVAVAGEQWKKMAFYGPTRQTATLKLVNWLKHGAHP